MCFVGNAQTKGFKMKFTYDADYDTLSLKVYKTSLEIWFNKGEAQSVTIGGNTFDVRDDSLRGIAVFAYDEWVSIAKIVLEAEHLYDDIVSDAEAEAEYEADMERELSSPRMMGRI